MNRFLSAAFSNAYLLLTLTALFWGGNFVLGRGVHEFFPPIALAWFRWTLAFLIVLPFAWKHVIADWDQIRANWFWLFFFGATGGGSFNTLSYIGLNHTTAVNALIINSSGPVLIAIASFAFFGDRLQPRQLLGICLSLTGVAVVVSQGDVEMLAGLDINKGDIWIFGAMIIWGIYTAFLRKRPIIHWLSFSAATFFVASFVNWPFFAWEALYVRQITPNTWTLLAIAYVSIFPSVIAYIFYNRGVELIGGNRAGIFLHLVPLFGSVLAIVLLGEVLRTSHVIGFALIVTGVLMAARAPKAFAAKTALSASRVHRAGHDEQ